MKDIAKKFGGAAKEIVKKFGRPMAVLIGSSVAIPLIPLIPGLGLHHEQIPFVDAGRHNRSVPVDVYYRRDKEAQAEMGMNKMPVVIISHGNTVKSSEYSFVANLFASRGYLVLSIQHDVAGDPPLPPVATQGTSYIPRWSNYMKGVANIDFVLGQFETLKPYADYDHLTLFGHSQGGDISVFYAKEKPYKVSRLITYDNLRIPFDDNTEAMTARGLGGPDFPTEKGVLPCEAPCEKGKVTVEKGEEHHTHLNDTASDKVKDRLRAMLSKFLERPLPKNSGNNPGQIVPY